MAGGTGRRREGGGRERGKEMEGHDGGRGGGEGAGAADKHNGARYQRAPMITSS